MFRDLIHRLGLGNGQQNCGKSRRRRVDRGFVRRRLTRQLLVEFLEDRKLLAAKIEFSAAPASDMEAAGEQQGVRLRSQGHPAGAARNPTKTKDAQDT